MEKDIINILIEKLKESFNNNIIKNKKDLEYRIKEELLNINGISKIIARYPKYDFLNGKNYIDLYFEYNTDKYFIEFEYKTAELETKQCIFKNHGAEIITCHKIYSNIERMERLSNKLNCKAYVLFITNDYKYWKCNHRRNTILSTIPLWQDKIVSGDILFDDIISDIEKKYGKNFYNLHIEKNYNLEWKDFASVNSKSKNNLFRYLLIK